MFSCIKDNNVILFHSQLTLFYVFITTDREWLRLTYCKQDLGVKGMSLEKKTLSYSLCGRHFSTEQTLQWLEKTHTGETDYECPVCGHESIQVSTSNAIEN